MLSQFWNRIRNFFTEAENSSTPVYKQLIVNEYNSVLYVIHRAHTLQQLIDARKRLRQFQQLLIENRLELWGRKHTTDLNTLWNAKFIYWKNKQRNR